MLEPFAKQKTMWYNKKRTAPVTLAGVTTLRQYENIWEIVVAAAAGVATVVVVVVVVAIVVVVVASRGESLLVTVGNKTSVSGLEKEKSGFDAEAFGVSGGSKRLASPEADILPSQYVNSIGDLLLIYIS